MDYKYMQSTTLSVGDTVSMWKVWKYFVIILVMDEWGSLAGGWAFQPPYNYERTLSLNFQNWEMSDSSFVML